MIDDLYDVAVRETMLTRLIIQLKENGALSDREVSELLYPGWDNIHIAREFTGV